MISRGKTLIISAVAIIAVIALAAAAFFWSAKAKRSAEGAAAAEKAAAAYASALAESSARESEALSEIRNMEEAAAEAEKTEKAEKTDYSGEAGLYSDFISGDSGIRNALSALAQDDPELIKNFRIRVDLQDMETASLPSGEGKRVRFTGSFADPKKRRDAVIRISGTEGSFKGRVYITGLMFNGEYSALSGLTDKDLASSHGAALRSVKAAELNGNPAVECEMEFTGDSEKDRAAVQFPLNDLDSSEFSSVYYDLFFEGSSPDLKFTTGCDFVGKDDISPDLDRINEAFAVFRGKAAAGLDPSGEEAAVKEAFDRMRTDLGVYPEEDPLVIRITDLLNDKEGIFENCTGGTSDSTDNAESGGSGKEEAAEQKNTGASAGIASAYIPSNDTGNGGSVLSGILPIILALIGIFMIIMLAFSLNRMSDRQEETEMEARAGQKKSEEAEELRAEIERRQSINRSINKKIDAALNKGRSSGRVPGIGRSSSKTDISAAERALGSIRSEAQEIGRMLDAIERHKQEGTAEKDITVTDAIKRLDDLAASNAALKENISGIERQMEETSGSVKNINKAATFISDIASETNLLALNASIEAARAGESGRGFAVVAGEISKLSDETEKSVTEITDTVDRLNSDFDKTGKLMQELNESASGQDENILSARKMIDRVSDEIAGKGKEKAGKKEDFSGIGKAYKVILEAAELLSSELSAIGEAAQTAPETEALLSDIMAELTEKGTKRR